MRHLLCVFVAVTAAHSSPLKDQLALAEKDENLNAQIELTRRLLDQEPANTDLHKRLAYLWLAISDYDMAERTVHDWKGVPEDVEASVIASVLYGRDNKRTEAAAILEAYLARKPDDLAAVRQLAGYLTALQQYQKLVTLLTDTPGVAQDANLLVTRALARWQAHDFPGALEDFALAQRVDPEATQVKNLKSVFERLQTGLSHIEKNSSALELKPEDPALLLSRAWWYLYIGYTSDLALADAAKAWKAAPDSVAALVLYNKAAFNLNQLTQAEAEQKYLLDTSRDLPSFPSMDRLWSADLLLAANPKDVAALQRRAYELNDSPQQYRLAIKDAQAILALDPKNPDGHLEKIFARVKLRQSVEAASDLREFEDTKPAPERLAAGLGYLTEIAFYDNQLDPALAYINRAIKAHPKAHYYKQRASILQRLGRTDEAEDDLTKARQMEKKK